MRLCAYTCICLKATISDDAVNSVGNLRNCFVPKDVAQFWQPAVFIHVE